MSAAPINTGQTEDGALPLDWREVPIGSVCDVNPRKPKANEIPADTEVSFIPMADVDDVTGSITGIATRPFDKVRNGYTSFRTGDVIMAKISPCMENGKAAIVGEMTNGYGFGSTEFHVMRPSADVDPRYLYHFIRQVAFRKEAEPEMRGNVGQRRVPPEFLREHTIPLPAKQVQHAIANLLDQINGHHQTATERLGHARSILRRFRRSVYISAAEGRLTEDWRNSNRDASTAEALLWEIHRNRSNDKKKPDSPHIASCAEFPDGWCQTTVSDIALCLDSRRSPINKAERASRAGTIPYYGANGQVGWIDKPIFNDSLVLVVEDETFLGRKQPFSYVIHGPAWVNNHAHVLKPYSPISADYLNVILAWYDWVPLTSGTTGRRKLTQASLVSAPVAIAPIEEQREIALRVTKLLNFADQIDAAVQAAEKRLNRTFQSTLAAAFRGELDHSLARSYSPVMTQPGA